MNNLEYNKPKPLKLAQDGSLGVEIDFVKVFGNNVPERLQSFKANQIPRIPAMPGEPVPPSTHYRYADHHWIQKIDSDGHVGDTICLQWNPGSKRWSHSGYVGSGIYVEAKGWKYVAHCPMPN